MARAWATYILWGDNETESKAGPIRREPVSSEAIESLDHELESIKAP